MEELLIKLADGTLSNEEVFMDSGHGTLVLRQSKDRDFPFLSVTGPRREMLRGSRLKPYEAVPHGDMMLTGCYGLLRAVADREPELAPAVEPSLYNGR